MGIPDASRSCMDEGTCMSYEEEDTCLSKDAMGILKASRSCMEEDTCMSYEQEHAYAYMRRMGAAGVKYTQPKEEDTCMSYVEEDTCIHRQVYPAQAKQTLRSSWRSRPRKQRPSFLVYIFSIPSPSKADSEVQLEVSAAEAAALILPLYEAAVKPEPMTVIDRDPVAGRFGGDSREADPVWRSIHACHMRRRICLYAEDGW
jgi:hypothetical protein